MERLHKRQMEHILITHAHFDHIGGLPEWADACRWDKVQGHVYAASDVLTSLRSMFPWLENQLIYHDCSDGFQWGDWHIRPWKVCHGKNGFSYAIRFDKLTGEPYRFAYCSDAINLNAEEKAPLHGLHLLVLGTNFYKEDADMGTRSVYDVVEALQLLKETSPARMVLTHMSHGIDIRSDYKLPASVEWGKTDMVINLD
jgi:phosphoribosyl 1,2-cyclic phosphate phosphodiesterase